MKKNRVDCFECVNFIDGFPGNRNKYACKLKKRIMFRSPIGDNWTKAGWIRYCHEFKPKI